MHEYFRYRALAFVIAIILCVLAGKCSASEDNRVCDYAVVNTRWPGSHVERVRALLDKGYSLGGFSCSKYDCYQALYKCSELKEKE